MAGRRDHFGFAKGLLADSLPVMAINHTGRAEYRAARTHNLAKDRKKRSFFPTIGTQSLLRCFISIVLYGVTVMLNILLNHNPAFLIGELVLALSLAMFALALVVALRERYSVRAPATKTRLRSAR